MGIPTLPIPKETGPNLIVFTYGSVMQIYAIIVSTGFLSTIFPFFLVQESAFVVEMARVELKVFADSHNKVISSVRGRLNMSFHFTRGLSYFLFVTVITQSQPPQSLTSCNASICVTQCAQISTSTVVV